MVTFSSSLRKDALRVWCVLTLLVLYFPVFFLFVFGFNGGTFALRWDGFSLRWYSSTLSNTDMLTALFNSLLVASLSTAIAVCLGFLYAWWAHRSASLRITRAADSLVSLPLFIPEIVIAIGLLVLLVKFVKPGFAGIGLSMDSIHSIVIGHATLALGYAALVLRTRFKSYDVVQEFAARDLGASGWSIFSRIMLPQIAPGLAAAACVSFAVSLDDFYVSYFLSTGGSSLKTLPLYIWSLQGRRAMTPEINVVSSFLLILALVFFGLGLYLSRSGRGTSETEKG
ncbi:ABC transporter permease [bacterium]|nr:ABC transporter permease [bacterium]